MSFEEPKRKIPESDRERHVKVIENLVEMSRKLSDEREELARIVIGLKEKFGIKDERVQSMFSDISKIEEQLQTISVAMGHQNDLYPTDIEDEKNEDIASLLKKLRGLKKELGEINLKVGEIANKLKDFAHDENLPRNKVYYEEVKYLKNILKDLEDQRVVQKELIQQIELDIKDLREEGQD